MEHAIHVPPNHRTLRQHVLSQNTSSATVSERVSDCCSATALGQSVAIICLGLVQEGGKHK
jgi:hypothetical protein